MANMCQEDMFANKSGKPQRQNMSINCFVLLMYLSALSDTKRLVNMFSMVKIYESSFEKSHWTGVKPADLHVFSCQWLRSGQGMQVQLIHCVQMYLLVEKPNIWQAAQSHILVEQTHTHTSFKGPSSIITFVYIYIPVLKVLSFTPISSTLEPSKIFKSCLVYPGPHFKNLTWEVLYTIFP